MGSSKILIFDNVNEKEIIFPTREEKPDQSLKESYVILPSGLKIGNNRRIRSLITITLEYLSNDLWICDDKICVSILGPFIWILKGSSLKELEWGGLEEVIVCRLEEMMAYFFLAKAIFLAKTETSHYYYTILYYCHNEGPRIPPLGDLTWTLSLSCWSNLSLQ